VELLVKRRKGTVITKGMLKEQKIEDRIKNLEYENGETYCDTSLSFS
jgi:hypothetical protein